ncbi:hypothetical protein SUGI_1019480 [Cryptomeria japonica]|nr:hypothetical protein SUGI_1019480 [Cryptomeria japonica]
MLGMVLEIDIDDEDDLCKYVRLRIATVRRIPECITLYTLKDEEDLNPGNRNTTINRGPDDGGETSRQEVFETKEGGEDLLSPRTNNSCKGLSDIGFELDKDFEEELFQEDALENVDPRCISQSANVLLGKAKGFRGTFNETILCLLVDVLPSKEACVQKMVGFVRKEVTEALGGAVLEDEAQLAIVALRNMKEEFMAKAWAVFWVGVTNADMGPFRRMMQNEDGWLLEANIDKVATMGERISFNRLSKAIKNALPLQYGRRVILGRYLALHMIRGTTEKQGREQTRIILLFGLP